MKTLLIALMTLCVVAPVVAQEMEPPPIVEAAHNGVAAFLQLTDEQISAWDAIYKIHVRGTQPGDQRLQVQLISDEVSTPVTNEESTHVYSDE